MKKLFLFLLTALSVSIAHASVNTPKDNRGETLPTVDFVGALPCSIDSSTSTNAVLCGSANARYVVYGVIATSVTATHYLEFRDTNTANTSSTIGLRVFPNGTGANASGASTTQTIKFPVPVKFSNGVSINASNAAAGSGLWTILYRPLSATE